MWHQCIWFAWTRTLAALGGISAMAQRPAPQPLHYGMHVAVHSAWDAAALKAAAVRKQARVCLPRSGRTQGSTGAGLPAGAASCDLDAPWAQMRALRSFQASYLECPSAVP
jgi:hypothetical protein